MTIADLQRLLDNDEVCKILKEEVSQEISRGYLFHSCGDDQAMLRTWFPNNDESKNDESTSELDDYINWGRYFLLGMLMICKVSGRIRGTEHNLPASQNFLDGATVLFHHFPSFLCSIQAPFEMRVGCVISRQGQYPLAKDVTVKLQNYDECKSIWGTAGSLNGLAGIDKLFQLPISISVDDFTQSIRLKDFTKKAFIDFIAENGRAD